MRAIVCVAIAILAAACPPPRSADHGQPGIYGRLDFYWPGSPLAAGGAHVPLHVARPTDGAAVAFARVESTHPEVATAEPFANGLEDIAVFTGEPGTTELRLYDDADTLLDAIALSVRAPARIDVGGGNVPRTVLANTIVHVGVEAIAEDGEELYGFFAVRAALSGATELPARERDRLPLLDFAFTPAAPSATVVFTADQVGAPLSLGVVTLDQLTDVQLGEEDGPGFQIVTARVLAGDTAVMNALCNWTTSDGDLAAAAAVPEGWLDFAAANTYYVPRRDHSLVVTCHLGALTASIDVPAPK